MLVTPFKFKTSLRKVLIYNSNNHFNGRHYGTDGVTPVYDPSADGAGTGEFAVGTLERNAMFLRLATIMDKEIYAVYKVEDIDPVILIADLRAVTQTL
jgi:hypothetical protein